MFKVVHKQTFTQDLYLAEIAIPAVAQTAAPGHYVDIHLNPDARPITLPLAGADPERGTITIVNRAQDLPSEQLMMLAEGDEVFQVRGPFGSACTFDTPAKVALAAEGLGVATLLWRARRYRENGAYTICVIGFPTRGEVYWQEEFAEVSDELYVATEDGSYGVSGRVTGPLQAVCDTHKDVERMIVIASLKTMKRAAKIAADRGVVARVSFDAIRPPARVASLFGTSEGVQEVFAFTHAPEIDPADIDFDKLIAKERELQADDENAAAA
jgi:ferredoxin--NADP+ reductase